MTGNVVRGARSALFLAALSAASGPGRADEAIVLVRDGCPAAEMKGRST